MPYRLTLIVLLLMAVPVTADEERAKTVIGPSNIHLYDGAIALKSGNAVEGVRLTLLGLKNAQGLREEKIGHANLCAGFVLLDQPVTALAHCDWVLERDDRHWRTYNNRALVYLRLERFDESAEDIRRGQALNPKSEKLKEVKGRYLDEVEPVTEMITIDERRAEPANPVEGPE